MLRFDDLGKRGTTKAFEGLSYERANEMLMAVGTLLSLVKISPWLVLYVPSNYTYSFFELIMKKLVTKE